jgi:DNA-binding CsgD family transcriptional regulator
MPDRAELRDALTTLTSTGEVDKSVRREIGASWWRSVNAGLRPDRFDVPHDPDLDTDPPLGWAARPVLDELTKDLATSSVGVLLTDASGHVLERRVSDRALQSQLDRIELAPGAVYAESLVGTNAIGTAIEDGVSVVEGREHFADALTSMTCAASTVADPRTGSVLGVVDLSCVADQGNSLMLPLVRRAARDIEARLLDDAPVDEQVLLRFAQRQSDGNDPVVVIGPRIMLTNPAAEQLVRPGDQPLLWDNVVSMLAGASENRELAVAGGTVVIRGCRPILDGGQVVGAGVLLSTARGAPRSSTSLGWESLTPTELRVVDAVCTGLTNREVAEQLLMSRFTVDSHLRAIFRKLGLTSRVALTRAAVEHGRVG